MWVLLNPLKISMVFFQFWLYMAYKYRIDTYFYKPGILKNIMYLKHNNLMTKILCDTDVLIDYLRGKQKAKNFIDQIDIIYISSISVAELYAGVRKGKELDELILFIDTFEVININKNIAKTGGLYCNKYKPNHGTGLADALIAATAKEIKARIATYNSKHFPMFDDVIQPV